MNRQRYALGYLKGRAEGFRRGLLTIANVEGAAKMAARYGIAHHDIAALLLIYGLAWDGGEVLETTRSSFDAT